MLGQVHISHATTNTAKSERRNNATSTFFPSKLLTYGGNDDIVVAELEVGFVPHGAVEVMAVHFAGLLGEGRGVGSSSVVLLVIIAAADARWLIAFHCWDG